MAVRDIIQAAGGSAATSAATYVEDVFSTYLYNGTGASQTITNGIDLSTKGGLVWIKSRSGNRSHNLFDTIRGNSHYLMTNFSAAQDDAGASPSGYALTSFDTTGFSLGPNWGATPNASGETYASWAFAKQAKFFDVVTYTGDGINDRDIAHNLGCAPGFIIVKRTDAASNWKVRADVLGIGATLSLNLPDAEGSSTQAGGWPTSGSNPSTVFRVRNGIDGSDLGSVNAQGGTYIAYLFASSNSGGFGAAGTDSVVACGNFVVNGSGNATVNLGWEPQYILLKAPTISDGWSVYDNMRGFSYSTDAVLKPNISSAEYVYSPSQLAPTATGFTVFGSSQLLTSTQYIYLAIRRGPMKTPTDATKVFAPQASGNPSSSAPFTVFNSGFPVDMFIQGSKGVGGNFPSSRLTGNEYLDTTSTAQAGNGSELLSSNTGVLANTSGYDYTTRAAWMFRRAPGFFDVVCYTGNLGVSRTHNLGVAPQLVIEKARSSAEDWYVSIYPQNKFGYLNTTASFIDLGNNQPTATTFQPASNITGYTYVAYLFATCPGVSKVFNFTGNGSSQTINCGFASGARFVLIKRTDSTGDWWVYDSARGIVSAADPALALNSTAAEVTSADAIDPDSSGFIVNQETTCNVNVNNATYIGLAIA